MNKHKNIFEMTDQEYRKYKILRKRRIETKNRIILFAIMFCMALILSFVVRTMHSSANSSDTVKYKYYKVITVEANDNLWKIADKYMDHTIYDSTADFVNEVVQINGIINPSSIKNGQKITIPYFSTEYK